MNGSENVSDTTSGSITTGFEIRRAAIPLARGAIPTEPFELIEIATATMPKSAVAFVFDLSDSCGPMPLLLKRLPTLLNKLPRKWPVWFYYLSDTIPAQISGSANVGHVIDGSVDLSSILSDRKRRKTAAGCGSFIEPVIDAIHERRAIEGLDETIICVVTDGALTDFSPAKVSPGLSIIGLTESLDKSADLVWRRILPDQSLFRLADPELDVCLGAFQQPSIRQCLVTVQGDGVDKVRRIHSDGSLQPFQSIEWDARTTSLNLLLPASTAESFTVVLNQLPKGPALRLKVSNATVRASSESVGAVVAALKPGPKAHNILINCVPGDNGFDDIWKAAVAAADCCNRNRRWQELRPAINPILECLCAPVEYRAALCVLSGDLSPPVSAASRVVVIGLNPDVASTIYWSPLQITSFGTPAESWRLRYDHMEGRWMLSLDNQVDVELFPRGSQSLGRLQLTDGSSVTILFSSDLEVV